VAEGFGVLAVEAMVVPQGEWRTRRDDGRDVAMTVTHQLAQWQCRSSFVGMWFRLVSDRLGPSDEARIVVDYDDKAGLLSFDAWVGDKRVYGADDFVG
jgi:hypothetical protein